MTSRLYEYIWWQLEIRSALLQLGLLIKSSKPVIEFEFYSSPHNKYKTMPDGKWAVYMFIDARKRKVVKCGQTKYKGRISQHYTYPKGAKSTLARSMILDRTRYKYYNKRNSERLIQKNFHLAVLLMDPIPGKHGEHVLNRVEKFFHVKFDPLYEG